MYSWYALWRTRWFNIYQNYPFLNRVSFRINSPKAIYPIYSESHFLTELIPSWGAANCAATQELPSILRNPKVQYRVHKSLPLVPILSHIHPIHSIPSYLSKITHLRLGLSGGLYPSGFPTIVLYAFFFSTHSCYMPHPSHPSWLDYSNYTWRRVQVMKFLIMQFSPTSCLCFLITISCDHIVIILGIDKRINIQEDFAKLYEYCYVYVMGCRD
jgi:hypothetical protein